MAGMWIKRTSAWSSIKNMWIKTTVGWSPVRSGYIRQNTSSTGWKRFWFKANLPNEISKPTIRTTNTSGTGTIYDGPVASSPQYLNTNLFGKDGTYSNYTSISNRLFSRADSENPVTRTVIVYDDRFTSAGGVTTAMRSACDEQYLFYEMTVSNGTDPLNSINSISNPIKMIKNFPALIDCGWSGAEEVGTQLAFNYSLENYYYNSVEPSSSYVRWWRSTNTDPGGTLLKQETITATTTGTPSSSSRTGTSYYTPTSSDIGYYIVAEIIAVSSYTRHNGYTDNYSLASFPTDGVIGSALTFSNVAVKDYYGQNGLDNRGRWPTGTLNQYTGQLSGYDSNTTIRIRYRIYNYDTGLYWKPSTGTQTTASAAWDSWNSDGSGNGYISNVSVSGGVATFYDYFDLETFVSTFNGGGSGPTWWLEIELSAVRGGPRVYYNSSNLIPETYYISKRIDPTVSVSPSTVGTNANVTISGAFAGFPATPSTNAYPRQYIVYYGDGTDSGYLPVGEYANGTINPTYSLTKSYSNTGTYTVTVRAVPHGQNATATVTVANLPTNTVAPTLTTNTGNFSAGSTITLNAGTWTGTNSYKYEILYGGSSPIADNSTSTKTLVNTNQYVITNADATASSYYFRGRVTGYSGFSQTGNSAIALTETSARSTITPSTTVSVGTATSSGFTVSGTASPLIYTVITEIQIWNSSLTSQVATITTGLPSPDTSTGAWSYVWTGGSASTTYYARVKIRSTDSDQTTITTGFAGPITTSAGVSTPTSLTATNNSGAIRLTFSGGSGDQYDIYYSNSSTRPTDGQAFADYPNVTSPYDPPLTSRNIERWFWVRKSSGSLRSNWYPSDSSVSIRLPLLAPPTPVITNSAQTSTSLSWHWTQPTPSSSQDEPTSWDYNISTSTATPTSWTNITTRPTSGSPLVTSSLSASTTYYLHVRAKNADASTTTYQSGTTSAASTGPTVPTSLSVTAGTVSSSLSTSLVRNSATNKTQSWTTSTSQGVTVSWTKGTGSGTITSEVKWNQTGITPTSSDSGTWTSISGSTQTDSNSGGTTNYYWVRTVDGSSNKSAWVYAGSYTAASPSMTGFSIRIYRGSGTSFSSPTSPPSTTSTSGSYTWSGLTNRDASPDFGHYAWASGTLNGTSKTATSSTV